MNNNPPYFSRKIIVIAIGLALIGTAAALSLTSEAAKPAVAAAPAALPVTVAPVVERAVIEWDEFSGRVEAIEYVEIRPRVSGTIDVIHFQEGQLVSALLVIEPVFFDRVSGVTQFQKINAFYHSPISDIETGDNSFS